MPTAEYISLAGNNPSNDGCWLATEENTPLLAGSEERIFFSQGSEILTETILWDVHMSSWSTADEIRKNVCWVLLCEGTETSIKVG